MLYQGDWISPLYQFLIGVIQEAI